MQISQSGEDGISLGSYPKERRFKSCLCNQVKKESMKKFRINDESLNAYGFWVKNDGLDFSDFRKNPICLYNHERGWRGSKEDIMPIGFWEDLNEEEMTAVPNLYMEDDYVKGIAGRIEHGTLRGASIGITVLEWSEDPSVLKPGQTRATVTRSKVKEISITDIPANKNAVALYDLDGNQINLTETINGLPPIINQKKEDMNLEKIAIGLSLSQKANLEDVLDAIEKLKEKEKKYIELKEEIQTERKKEVDSLMDSAGLSEAERKAYTELFHLNYEAAKIALESRPKELRLSDVTKSVQNNKISHEGKTFRELEKENPKALQTLKEDNFEAFCELYKASYGVSYKK